MKMMNHMTSSAGSLRTALVMSTITAGALFATVHSADAQSSSNRRGGSIARTEGKGDRSSAPSPLVALNWQVLPQIMHAIPAVEGNQLDRFGASCAMNEAGTILVVGASDAWVDGSPAIGAVYIFEYLQVQHAWTFVQRLVCPPKLTFAAGGVPVAASSPGLALFGWSVAVSNETIVVGAPVVTPALAPTMAGGAYVFQKAADGKWGVLRDSLTFDGAPVRDADKRLKALSGEQIAFFGGSVAVDVVGAGATDTRIAVGSPYRGVANQGGAHVFEGNGNTFTEVASLISEDVVGHDQFGTRVAIDGPFIVVGAQVADIEDILNAGAAYVFERAPGGGWTTIPRVLQRPVPVANDGFGSSISIVGHTIAVGAPGADLTSDGDTFINEGSAHIFRLVGAEWAEDGVVYARDANSGNAFGYSIALAAAGELDGNQLIVGTPGYEIDPVGGGTNSGAGFCFTRTGPGDWDMTATDLWNPNARAAQGLGEQVTVSLDGTRATLGSSHNVSGGTFSTAIASEVFGWTSNADAIAGGTVGVATLVAPTAAAPGAGLYDPDINTTGTGSGGGLPSDGGMSGGSDPAIPAAPTEEEWGIVRTSVIAVDRAISRLMIITTDGNGQLNTKNESRHFLCDYDPTWELLGLGDVNGDGSSDILFLTTNRKVKAKIRLGHEIVDTVTVGTITTGDRFMGISDWSGNGFEGPAFLHADGHSAVFWVVRQGSITDKIEAELGAGNWTFKTADMDGDGTPDLIVRDAAANTLAKVNLSASGVVTLLPIPNPGPSWRIACVQDFDDDGSADFVWENSTDHTLEFFFLNSNGTVRFRTPWDSNLSGWQIDSGASFSTGAGTGVIFSKGGAEVLVLTVRFESLATPPAGRGNIRVDYSRVFGALEQGYTILGPADEP